MQIENLILGLMFSVFGALGALVCRIEFNEACRDREKKAYVPYQMSRGLLYMFMCGFFGTVFFGVNGSLAFFVGTAIWMFEEKCLREVKRQKSQEPPQAVRHDDSESKEDE